MFSNSADYYDLIYSSFKNYDKEVRKLHAIINESLPEAKTVLDVACGTAKHAEILHANYGYKVDGIDLEQRFVEIAQKRIPSGKFHQADMKDFSLGEKYDVVVCLFSSIGYLRSLGEITQTLRNFKEHLSDDGIIIVEPWFTPEEFTSGLVHVTSAENEEVKIVRMSQGKRGEDVSIYEFHYLIGNCDGITNEREIHELRLSSVEEMTESFNDAELDVDFDDEGLIGRGLYTAKKQT